MRKRRVIVYDDDPIVLSFLKDFLSSIDYEVLSYQKPIVCPFSREGDGRCDQRHPCADIVITDYQMPRMSGLELIQEQTRRGCMIPTKNKAIMTGDLHEGLQKKAEEAGIAFFQKPVNMSELSSWLVECRQRSDILQPLATRRKEIRHAINREIQCRVDRGQIISGTTVDMSNNGLSVRLASPVVPKQTVYIETELPVIACSTTSVQWVNKNRDGSYQAGLICL